MLYNNPVKKFNISLLPALLVIFMDMLGYGIVIPVLTDFLFDSNSGFLAPGAPEDTHAILYGFLAGIYPLAQFFGAPLLGTLSDRFGRKKLLLISLVGTFIGYALLAIGIMTKNIPLMLFGRALDGFTGGNISIAFSTIADLSDKETKAKNFGYAGAAFGIGLIMGPYLGGRLSDPNLISWFNLSTPFWISCVFTVISVLFVLFGFKETLHTKIHSKISWFTGVKHVISAFKIKKLRLIFFVIFLLSLGFTIFVNFFPILLKERFNFDKKHIGNMFAYAGVCTAIGLGVINNILIRKTSAKRIMFYAIILLSLSFFLLSISHKLIYVYIVIAFISLFHGLNQPNSTSIVSNLSSEETQGEILGINQSIQSLAQSIPTIAAGFILSKYKNPEVPILLAAVATLAAWIIFIYFFKSKKYNKEKFHEEENE
jgi:DHA1 family tetracycline resistance protein-like MFS transporter